MDVTENSIKRGILLSVGVSITAIIFVILYTQDELTLKIFTRMKPWFLILSFMLTLSFWGLKSLKLKIMAGSLGTPIALKKVFSIFMASVFVSHVTPSSTGGLPFTIYFLHRQGLSLGESTALNIVENMLTIIFFMIISPFLLFLWGDYLNLTPGISRLFYLLIFLVFLFVIFSLLLIFNSHLAAYFINWITDRNLLKSIFPEEKLIFFRKFIKEEILLFREGIHLLLRNKGNFLKILFFTILYWSLYLSLPLVLLKGLSVKVAIPPVILAQIVFNLFQPLIPTPGGSGGAELGFAYLFKFLIPDYLLGIFVALWRFFMFYLSLIIGGFYFLQLVRGTEYLKRKRVD